MVVGVETWKLFQHFIYQPKPYFKVGDGLMNKVYQVLGHFKQHFYENGCQRRKKKKKKQAGAELGQAQVRLKVLAEVVLEDGVEVEEEVNDEDL